MLSFQKQSLFIKMAIAIIAMIIVILLIHAFPYDEGFRNTIKLITKPFLIACVISFFASYIISIITEEYFSKKTIKTIAEACKSSISVLNSGLKEVKQSWKDVNYKEYIKNSKKEITMVSFYAGGSGGFVQQFEHELREFMTKNNGKITFLLANKNDKDLISCFNKKFKEGRNDHRGIEVRIDEAVDKIGYIFDNITKSKQKKLNVKFYKYAPAYTLFKFDETILVTPYLNHPDHTTDVPVLILKKEGLNPLYDIYNRDLNNLITNSESWEKSTENNKNA